MLIISSYISSGEEADDAELETPKIYEEIPSFQDLCERLNMYMQLYNEAVRGAALDLVFFKVRRKNSFSIFYAILKELYVFPLNTSFLMTPPPLQQVEQYPGDTLDA